MWKIRTSVPLRIGCSATHQAVAASPLGLSGNINGMRLVTYDPQNRKATAWVALEILEATILLRLLPAAYPGRHSAESSGESGSATASILAIIIDEFSPIVQHQHLLQKKPSALHKVNRVSCRLLCITFLAQQLNVVVGVCPTLR